MVFPLCEIVKDYFLVIMKNVWVCLILDHEIDSDFEVLIEYLLGFLQKVCVYFFIHYRVPFSRNVIVVRLGVEPP